MSLFLIDLILFHLKKNYIKCILFIVFYLYAMFPVQVFIDKNLKFIVLKEIENIYIYIIGKLLVYFLVHRDYTSPRIENGYSKEKKISDLVIYSRIFNTSYFVSIHKISVFMVNYIKMLMILKKYFYIRNINYI